ncbi:MAG: PAS domain-containing methyl-accepting chemotaxis protein, partial [Pseudomonadales bacterium]|nr:PAS domain-containing methyl-accepting chemotaxis protein [Pseudomonadales bacterium]
KNPAHQRKLLDDPNNLPYKTEIAVGELTFALNVSAMKDTAGNYIGNTLEWSNATEVKALANESARISSAVDGSATAMMMVDRDFIITYANQSTVDMVKENLEHFEKQFKGFDLEGLLGTCIDIFHKNPAHQRKLLDDPNNLPYKTEIAVGPLTFALNVSAMKDTAGEYIGNTLEWSNVSEAKALADEAARINSAVDGSSTAMMMVDRDFIITYANPATVDMVSENLDHFKGAFKGFDLEGLLGTCIDTFHKNPAHQRKLLADPTNLPYKTEIAVGELSFSLNVSAMTNTAGDYIGNTLEWSNITADKKAAADLQSTIDRVEQGTGELNAASVSLSELASGMVSKVEQVTEETAVVTSGAEQMSTTMINVSSASEEASGNIDSVAVATEEMTNTVNDIANNAEKARDVTQNAVRNVEQASARVGELGQAAKEISMVIEAIVEIAEQTKLLALNATIEAARAGEAGKGFAVVANEVKELAKQTRDATADIRTKIENIQASTDATVTEIGNINSVIGDVNEIVTIIATAVEEQNVTTKDIANNIGQASQGVKAVTSDITQTTTVSKEMASNLGNINQGIGEIKSATDEVDTQVQDVSRTAGMLQALVDELKSKQQAS